MRWNHLSYILRIFIRAVMCMLYAGLISPNFGHFYEVNYITISKIF